MPSIDSSIWRRAEKTAAKSRFEFFTGLFFGAVVFFFADLGAAGIVAAVYRVSDALIAKKKEGRSIRPALLGHSALGLVVIFTFVFILVLVWLRQ